jgi:hypothetical protein
MYAVPYLSWARLGRSRVWCLGKHMVAGRDRGRLTAIAGPIRARLGSIQPTAVGIAMLHVSRSRRIGRILPMRRVGRALRRNGRIYRYIIVRPRHGGFVRVGLDGGFMLLLLLLHRKRRT